MNMKSRKLMVSLVFIIILLFTVLLILVRVTDNQVVLNKMSGFNEVLPNSERVIVDKGDVQQFTYAVRFANEHQEEVDISAPPFMFTLGNKQYYLWISEAYGEGTLMKLPNTSTIYTIDESRVSKLLNILHTEYENPLELNQ